MNTHRTLCLVLKANLLEQPAVTHAYVTEHQPERAAEVRKLLEMHGGCSAGCKIANIDPPNSAARVWTF
jgi:methionine-rich copper-binding protein CopC